MIGLLCKGSTTDFDSVCLGSNPSNPTKKASVLAEVFYLHKLRFSLLKQFLLKVNKNRR